MTIDELKERVELLAHEREDLLAALKDTLKDALRWHLNDRQWIQNVFECPTCRKLERYENLIARIEGGKDE